MSKTIDFDFKPNPEHLKTGKVCFTKAQFDFAQKLVAKGQAWRIKILHQAGFPLTAANGTAAMLNSAVKMPVGRKFYYLVSYITTI